VVVFEADRALVGILKVGPGLHREWQDGLGELGVLGVCRQAAKARYMVASQSAVGGIAEPGHGA